MIRKYVATRARLGQFIWGKHPLPDPSSIADTLRRLICQVLNDLFASHQLPEIAR